MAKVIVLGGCDAVGSVVVKTLAAQDVFSQIIIGDINRHITGCQGGALLTGPSDCVYRLRRGQRFFRPSVCRHFIVDPGGGSF